MWWGFAIHSAQWTIHPLPSQIIPVAECYDIKGVGPLRVASLYNYSWLHAKRMLSPLCVWQVNATGLCASEMTVRIEIRNSERCRGFAATRCRKFLQQFLGTLAKLRKENFSFVMSVCLSVSLTDCSSVCVSVRMVKSATTEEIFIKLDVWVFFENLLRKFKFNYNLTRMKGTVHGNVLYLWHYMKHNGVSATKIIIINIIIIILMSRQNFNKRELNYHQHYRNHSSFPSSNSQSQRYVLIPLLPHSTAPAMKTVGNNSSSNRTVAQFLRDCYIQVYLPTSLQLQISRGFGEGLKLIINCENVRI